MNHKGNKQWIWLALDADTREIVGVYVGARDEAAAQKLWQSLPAVYRQCAIAYTDFWTAYAAVLPSKRHRCLHTRQRTRSAKKRERPAMLSDSTTLYANGFLVLSVKHCHSRSRLRIMLVLSGILFTPTTNHYLCSTTGPFRVAAISPSNLLEQWRSQK